MAVFSERVQIIVDFVEQKAAGKSALGNVLGDIKSAEGGLGKLKAAGAGVGQALSGLGWTGVAAGASAAAVFIGKATDAFEQLALSASKFGDATGLAVDDASRWIEVAGDIGVSTDTIQTAFAKLNSTIQSSPEKLGAYGIAIAKAKDGSVDLNGTILNVIAALNKMDPSSRAAAMKDIFGKGAVGAAELFNMNVEDIRKNLEAVSDAKVIDPDEVEKAKRLRQATDTLKDIWEDIVLTIGESAAELAPVLEMVGKIVAKAQELEDKFKNNFIFEAFQDTINPIHAVTSAWDDLTNRQDKAAESTRNVVGEAITGFSDMAAAAAASAGGGDTFFNSMFDGIQQTVQGLADIGAAWDELQAGFDQQTAVLDIADDFDKVRDAAIKSWEAATSGSEDAAGAARDHQRAVIGLKEDVAKYGKEVMGLPPDKVTEILAQIDHGSITTADQALDALTKARTVQVQVQVTQALKNAIYIPGVGKPTQLASPQAGLLGAPVATPSASATIGVPMAVMASQPVTNVQVNMPAGSVPSDVVGAIQKWAHRNGSLSNAGVRSG